MPDRWCKECGKTLGPEVHKNRLFCSKICRDKSSRATIARRKRGKGKPATTKAIADLRKLAKFSNGDDPAVIYREVLTEAIRENVSQYVQDNLLGAGEALTNLLPKVMAGLALDLESKDDFIRTRAQAAVLKYAMEFKDKAAKQDDLGTIQVIHNVALPNTPLGQRIEEEIVIESEERAAIEAGLESFELDYPACSGCGERKHPDALRKESNGPKGGERYFCSSCTLKRTLSAGRNPTALFTRDPEFGRPEGDR